MFEGEPGGGLYPATDGEKGIKVYFEVDDIDAEIGRIRDAGGETEEKMPVPSMGWFAHAKDTEGNAFSVWQSGRERAGARGHDRVLFLELDQAGGIGSLEALSRGATDDRPRTSSPSKLAGPE